MFDILKEMLISEEEVSPKLFMKNLKSTGLYKKQFDRFWWQYVFDSWLFDRNK